MNKGKPEKKEESKDSLPKLPKIKQAGKPPIINRPECVPEVKFDDELSDSKRGEFKMSGCVPLKNPSVSALSFSEYSASSSPSDYSDAVSYEVMFRDTNVVLTECYERYKSTRDDLERLKELLRGLTTKVERSKTTEEKGKIIDRWINKYQNQYMPEK